MNKVNDVPTDLEGILRTCGSSKPFKKDGSLSKSGSNAYDRLLRIVAGLEMIGVGVNSHTITKCTDEIITRGE